MATPLPSCVTALRKDLQRFGSRCTLIESKALTKAQLEGGKPCELEISHRDYKFTAKKVHAWTCTSGMSEAAANEGTTVAVIRITDLLQT